MYKNHLYLCFVLLFFVGWDRFSKTFCFFVQPQPLVALPLRGQSEHRLSLSKTVGFFSKRKPLQDLSKPLFFEHGKCKRSLRIFKTFYFITLPLPYFFFTVAKL